MVQKQQPRLLIHPKLPMSSLEYQPEPELQAMLYSTLLRPHQMKLKYQILLLVVTNVPLHKRPNQWIHNKIVIMMMAVMTTMYCHKIWIQIALKMLPIATIFYFNTKTLHEILCHIVNVNPLPANFTIEKHYDARVSNGKFSTTTFNNTTSSHRCPHFKERGPHVNTNSTETTMNATCQSDISGWMLDATSKTSIFLAKKTSSN